jgi:thiamine-monophosphate kinase
VPGEFDFIQWLATQQSPHGGVRTGIGDDLAVLKWRADDLLLVGVDQVLDGVHFDSAVHGPREIGAKAMNRNLSDCAAMAALPAAAVAAVALPHGVGTEYARELYHGMREAADRFDCALVGGDTGSWPGKLAVSVTILGRSAGVVPVTRSGAQAGDGIFVTGPLGGSIGGRHMRFEPRVKLARELATQCRVTAMIDLSDGLSRDLAHICRASGVGALIDSGHLPLHADIASNQRPDWSAAEHAVNDGEDYELLFTAAVCEHPSAVLVGEITQEPGVRWVTARGIEPLLERAWEHPL